VKVLLVKCYHPELKKYFAGYGYKKNNKFHIIIGGGNADYLDLEVGPPEFEAVQGEEVEPELSKAFIRDWSSANIVPENADKFLREHIAKKQEWEARFPEETT
jgi:hypothetical protein